MKSLTLNNLILILMLLATTVGCSAPQAANTAPSPERVELTYFIKVKCPEASTTYGSDLEFDPVFHEGSRKIAILRDYYTVTGNKAFLHDVPDVGIDIPVPDTCIVTKEEGGKKFFVQ